MPQQVLSPEALKAFTDLSDDEKVSALQSMSPGTKALLLGALKGQPQDESQPQVAKAQVFNVPSSMGNLPINLPPSVANIVNKVKDFITPTPRGATRMVGAALGGAAGVPAGPAGIAYGGALGAAGGDALYQTYNAYQGNQGELNNTEIVKAMGEGALQEGLGPALEGPGSQMLERGSVNTIGRLTKPATEGEKKVVREVASQVAGDFPVAGSTPALLQKYTDKLNTAGRELDAAYQAVPSNLRIRSTPLKAAVQAERAKLVVQGAVPPGSEAQAKAYDEVIQWFDQHPSFTIDELRQNKGLFDKVVNWYRGSMSAEPAKEQAYEAGANAIRNTIGNIFPSIAEKNAKVHAWKTLTDSLARADVKSYGKMANVLPDAVRGGLGALVGYAAGGPEGAAIGGVGAAAVNEILQSTAFQSASVPIRNATVQLLKNGNVQGAIHLLSAIGAGSALKAGERAPISLQPQ